MVDLQRQSPLGTAAGAPPPRLIDRPGLALVEEPFLPVWSLRLSRRLDASGAALVGTGLPVPTAPNRCSGDAQRSCAWIEPRAWLVLGGEAPVAPAQTWVTELSDRYSALRLSGRHAAELLSSAAPLPALASGECARTRFAEEIEIFVQRLADTDAGPQYRLLFDAPLARLAVDWLEQATRRAAFAA